MLEKLDKRISEEATQLLQSTHNNLDLQHSIVPTATSSEALLHLAFKLVTDFAWFSNQVSRLGKEWLEKVEDRCNWADRAEQVSNVSWNALQTNRSCNIFA
jgi:hypothetical protein